MSKDPVLMEQFCEDNQENLSNGYAPFSIKEGYYYGPKEIVKNSRYTILLLLRMVVVYTILIT